jgi:hypothetical protein
VRSGKREPGAGSREPNDERASHYMRGWPLRRSRFPAPGSRPYGATRTVPVIPSDWCGAQ